MGIKRRGNVVVSRFISAVRVLSAAFVSACCLPFSEVNIEESIPAWEAAFKSPVPEGVVLTHGQYWKGIHWSNEYSWFFAMEPNETFLERFVEYNQMEVLTGVDQKEDLTFELLFTPPEWFAPSGSSYQIWRSEQMFLFLDKDQRTIFVHSGVL